jgi:glutathione S-transferase
MRLTAPETISGVEGDAMNKKSAPALVLCELADASAYGVESRSPFCLKAHRALRVAGLAYEQRHFGRPAELRPLSPTGQVPVLLVDGAPVADSTRILERIDDLTGALTRGLDPRARAEAWLWEDFADTAVNGFLVAARWADERNWPAVRDAYFGDAPWPVRALVVPRIRSGVIQSLVARDVWRAGPEACWERLEKLLDQLDARAPANGFWVGGASPSVADVSLFAQLHSLRTPLTAPQREAVARRKVLSAYLDRVDVATQRRATTVVTERAAGEAAAQAN